MFSSICVWINGWVNNREAGDLRCYRAHYDFTVMNFVDNICPVFSIMYNRYIFVNTPCEMFLSNGLVFRSTPPKWEACTQKTIYFLNYKTTPLNRSRLGSSIRYFQFTKSMLSEFQWHLQLQRIATIAMPNTQIAWSNNILFYPHPTKWILKVLLHPKYVIALLINALTNICSKITLHHQWL